MKDLKPLSELDTAEVLADISSVVFEGALGRLLLELEEAQLEELEQYLQHDHEPEQFAEYLLSNYPNFKQYLEEEMGELEEKAKMLHS